MTTYWTHLTICAWVCHNILPSRLYGQRSCHRAEVCCTARATWSTRSRNIDQHWSGHPSRHARPSAVVRACPGGSCKAIHDAEFGVGDSYHVMGSERDKSTVWSRLAGNGMLRFPAITAGRTGGRGQSEHPRRVMTQHFGVAPRLAAYKGLSAAFDLSLPCLASRSSCCSTLYVIA